VTEGQQMVTSDPDAYWRPLRPGETVYALTDLVEESAVLQNRSLPMDAQMDEQAARLMTETVERLVRELAPEIIERVIREEIDRLKREAD
jgi:hypothetical protein